MTDMDKWPSRSINSIERYGRWISYLYRYFQIYINNSLADVNITSSEFVFVLLIHQNHNELIQNDLAKQIRIDKAAVARSISSLEQKGYVYRHYSADNRKSKIVELTEKGQQVCGLIIDVINKWNGMIEDGISPEDLAVTARTLRQMAENVQ